MFLKTLPVPSKRAVAFQPVSSLIHRSPVSELHAVSHRLVLRPSVEVEELDTALLAVHLLVWNEVGRCYVRSLVQEQNSIPPA